MAQSSRFEVRQESMPADPYPDYRPIYAWVFQSWLVMFLAVICLGLIFYLVPHIQGLWHRMF